MNASLMKWLALSMVGLVMTSAVVLASSVQSQAPRQPHAEAQAGPVVLAAAPAASAALAE